MTDRRLILLGAAHVHLDDHLRVAADEGWSVSHVHDRDSGRRNQLCNRLSAKPLESMEALGETDAAGAVVCSETVFHQEDICAALGAGLPVFSEKPLAASESAARRCADMAERSGLLLHTGYFMRTNPALARIRQWVEEHAIGDVHAARMRFSHDGGFADWLDLDAWMTIPELACYDGFVDEAVHCIDLLQWILGPVRNGAARTGNALGWPLDDHGAAVLSFENGATGVVEAGWTDTAMRLELELVGATGDIRLADGEGVITTRNERVPADRVRLAPLDAGEGIRAFLHALEGGSPAGLVPPTDATRVNALLDAMSLNLREGPDG